MRKKNVLSITDASDKFPPSFYQLKKSNRVQRWLMVLFIAAATLIFAKSSQAQFTATWGLTAATNKTGAAGGAQAASITVADMIPGTIFSAGTHNNDGFRCQIPSGSWPTAATDGYNIDFPLSENGSYDLNLTGLTLTGRCSGGSGNSMVSLAYQADGTGAWTSFGAPQALASGGTTNADFGALATSLPSGHTYIIRLYVYASGTTSSSRNVYIKNVVFSGTVSLAGLPPTVLTTAASATGTSTGSASGDITSGGAWPVTVSGFCWDLATDPTVALTTKTIDGPTSGPFTSPISGLLASTTYHVRAYATSAVGTAYGADLTFTTAPATIATLTTAITTANSPVTAASGGDITDNGGDPITQRGVCWNTTGAPTYPANTNTNDGTGSGAFSSLLSGLLPSTTYFVRAYAINSVGTAYGNEVSFTTPAATPTILVVPDSLGFGAVLQGTTSANQSYSISGFFLAPATGNIIITAPAGYLIATSTGARFASSLSLPYTGSTLAATTIYVQFAPASLANYNKNITNSGGGAPSQNVKVTGLIDPVGGQGQQGFSNKGKDFWVGYGATEKMTSDNAQDLRFTFNNPNSVDANITISIPNQAGFTPITYIVPANSILTTNPGEIAEGADPAVDARLLSEGVFNSGIHIVSDQPIVAYAHDVTSQVYAATVLFPTPTLGREYISLNFTQRFNSSSSANRSYCFAIATEDNTLLEVVLPAGVSTETHADGTTFTQLLNKGEILNLFGASTGSETAIDMSGVIVRSLSGTTGCKPFAFFCGSGKITIDCSTNTNVSNSGDNLFQQMFPKVAWGYKYITVPTLPSTNNINHFRVLVDDAAAVVKRNGVTLAGLINNSFYEYLNTENSVDVIESDKPIMVAQYMTSHGQCGNPAASVGDPEMIYLSSVQQTIDTVSLVSSPLGNSSGRQHFINVTTKTVDAGNFLLDGAPVTFSPVTNDPTGTYSYAQIPVAESSHTMTSPRGFNAIAYGVAGDESYGYNAGTNLVDLLSGFNVQNEYASGTSVAACRGSQFYMRVTLAFRATSIIWDFNSNPNLVPSASITETNPVPEDSVKINGVQLFIYKLATPFVYNALGSFDVKVTANNPTPDGCDGNKTFTFPVTVNQGPAADFTFSSATGCLVPVQFTDASLGNGGTVNAWKWDFGDTHLDSIQNPIHTFTAGGNFNIKLRAITAEGCYDDTLKVLTVSGAPLASFTANDNGCTGIPQSFTNTSTIATGTITQWNWNFGDGPGSILNAPNGNPQTYTYATPGTYTATLTVVSSTGCSADTSLPIVINPGPSDFSAGPDVETPFGQTATLTGTGPATNTYLWSPASVVSPTSLVTISTTTDSSTIYTLTATNSFGCKATDEMLLRFVKLCVDPPNVFTPNGDGFYDKWIVINGTCTKEVKVNVYNRWGGLVYSNAHYNNEWDGTRNGAALPDGTYYYVVQVFLTNGGTSQFKGNVTIMR